MKILTAAEMAAADQAAFSRVGLPSRAVMENAGRQVTLFLLDECSDRLRAGVLVLAGSGNNGGDGFVVARTLLNFGVWAEVALLKPISSLSGDAKANAESFLQCSGKIVELSQSDWCEAECLSRLGSFGVLVDALYGTGFKGSVRGFAAELISFVNARARASGLPIVSVDIASGVESDTGAVHGPVIEAQATVALQCLKLGHVLFPGSGYCGKIYVAEIGIPPTIPEIEGVERELITEKSVSELLSEYLLGAPDEHKGSRGHVLVVGGGAGHFGAPKLSGQAALTSGAGLGTLVMPESAAKVLAPQLEELMCEFLPSNEEGRFSGEGGEKLRELAHGKQAIVFGPGVGTEPGIDKLLRVVLELSREGKHAAVIDADGLNVLADRAELKDLLNERVVLTPHPGEMGRLLGKSSKEVQENRLGFAMSLSREYGCWVVLKGARTVVSGPEGQVWLNPAATLTLATAGSGDVLAGIIAAFLARNFPAGEAARAAVFVHGCAGEAALLDRQGIVGTLAGDIVLNVPRVVNALLRFRPPPASMLEFVLPGGMHRVAEMLGYPSL